MAIGEGNVRASPSRWNEQRHDEREADMVKVTQENKGLGYEDVD